MEFHPETMDWSNYETETNKAHKRQAMEACVAIYADYTKEEVQQMFPPSIQFAWFVGRDISGGER